MAVSTLFVEPAPSKKLTTEQFQKMCQQNCSG